MGGGMCLPRVLVKRAARRRMQLGFTPYDNNGNFVATLFAAVNGNFPIRSTIFLAPGALLPAFGGLRVTFWRK